MGLRREITELRLKLRLEENRFRRASIYLQLTDHYRLLVRMKNARLELRRAFTEIGLVWPRNSYLSVAKLILRRPTLTDQMRGLHRDFQCQPRTVQVEFLAELYEELGLSAYYLRQHALLLQSSLLAEAPCLAAGPSRALLNWYGGSACVMALTKRRQQGLALINSCTDVAKQMGLKSALAKSGIWSALFEDYSQNPARSAQIFTTTLQNLGPDMDSTDWRLATATLTVNLFWRGHARDSLLALNGFTPMRPQTSDSASWLAIPGKAMLGEVSDLKNFSRVFGSIFTADNDEKWLLTQFIGNLLIAHYWTQSLDDSEIDNLIGRFEILRMAPRNTHTEASYYWTARGYIVLSRVRRGVTPLADLRQILSRIRKVPKHPTARSHELVLRAGLALLEKREREFLKLAVKADALAKSIENDWALFELERLRFKCQSELSPNSTLSLEHKTRAVAIAAKQGWRISNEF